AEERRLQPGLAEPGDLRPYASGRIATGWSGMRWARPVRVEPERRSRGRDARALEPARFVLAVREIGRPDQRDHVEAARAFALQRVEAQPGSVVEWALDVARHHRGGPGGHGRHTVAHVRDLRTLFAVGASPGGVCRRDASADPPSRPRPR